MSFLSTHFSSDMRPLTVTKQVRAKNDIGEMVDTDSTIIRFKGVILRVGQVGSGFMIEKSVPMEEVTHTLRCELSISIHRDDIITDRGVRYIVKHLALQEDF